MKRRSAMAVGHSAGELISEPRPIKDKSFMRNSKRAIVEWLSEHDFRHPVGGGTVTMESMDPLSTTLFRNMCEFMFRQIDRSFMMNDMSKDVPLFLERIGYPIRLKSNAFSPVGAPHTLPHLWAALQWLVSVLRYDDHMKELYERGPPEEDEDLVGQGEGDDEDALGESARMEFDQRKIGESLCDLYGEWLAGMSLEQVDQKLEEELNERLTVREDIEQYKSANQKFEKELKNVYGDCPKSEDQLTKELDELKDRKEKWIKYERQWQERKASLQQNIKTAEEKCAEMESVLKNHRNEIEEMKKVLENQEISPEDVARMKNEQKSIDLKLEQASLKIQSKEKEIYSESHQCLNIISSMQDGCEAFNKCARTETVGLIPSTAVRALGSDFRLRLSDVCQQACQSNNLDPVLEQATSSMVVSSSDMDQDDHKQEGDSSSSSQNGGPPTRMFRLENVLDGDWQSNFHMIERLVDHFEKQMKDQQSKSDILDADLAKLNQQKTELSSQVELANKRIEVWMKDKEEYGKKGRELSEKHVKMEEQELIMSRQRTELESEMTSKRERLKKVRKEQKQWEEHYSEHEGKMEQLFESIADGIAQHRGNVLHRLMLLDEQMDQIIQENHALDAD